MIPQETVNLILDTAKIEEVVGDFISLKRRGASYVACCPFHNEKTPSFYVTPSKGIFKCFGCGKSGTAVGFVMEYEHLDYPGALRYLANKYHIEIQEEELTPEEIVSRQKRESLYLVSEFAANFFNSQLSTPEGKGVGLAYFHKRGVEDATIAQWKLGWAPSGRETSLVQEALKAGYKEEYLIDAGLASRREDGSLVDRFRERVMFPILSLSGRVIAFSGRTLRSDNPAKYVNSPETEIYTKGKSLLGIWFAKSEIARLDRCILVEGNLDVVTMHQLGVKNVVASCGTALTEEQVRLIHRFTSNLTIMYDADSAGLHAAEKATALALPEGMNVRIVVLPEGDDPDSFGRSHTLSEVQEYIASHEQDFISFKTDRLLVQSEGDPYRKAALINDVADLISLIPDAVQRSVYVQEASSKFGIEQQIIYDRIAKTRRAAIEEQEKARMREQRRSEQESPAQQVQTSPEKAPVLENRTLAPLEEDLLSFLLRFGDRPMNFESDSPYYSDPPMSVSEFIREAISSDGSHFSNTPYRKTFEAYFEAYDKGLDHDAIIRALFDSPDDDIREVTGKLAIEKYTITVRSFADSMMSEESWLVNYIPKTILMYAQKRLKLQCDFLRKSISLASDSAEQTSLMQQLIRAQQMSRKIEEQIRKS